MLRDLNKAYAGFLCQQDRGDISTELLALKVKRASIAMLEESYGSKQPQQPNALGNMDVASQTDGPVPASMSSLPPISIPSGGFKEPPPLSPIKEVSESPRASLTESPKLLLTDSATSSLVASILQSGIQMAVGKGGMLSMATPTAPPPGGDAVADSAAAGTPKVEVTETPVSDAANRIASSLADSILEGVKEASGSEPTKEPDSEPMSRFQTQSPADSTDAGAENAPTAVEAGLETKPAEIEDTKKPVDSDVAERVAASLTSSLFKDVKKATPAKKPTGKSVDDVVASLTESIFKFSPPPVAITSDQPPTDSAAIQSKAAELTKSIIFDILSEQKAPSVPFQGPTQTVAQQSHDVVTSRREVTTFASHLARSIVLDAVVTVQSETTPPVPAGPAIVVQGVSERRGSRESGRSSRSSSLTGQSLTLHEFADDVVESAIKQGVTESFSQMYEARSDEPMAGDSRANDPKVDDSRAVEPKADEPKADEPKADEPKADERKADEPKADEPKADEPKADEPKADEPKADEPKADEGSKVASAVTSTKAVGKEDSGIDSFAKQLVSQSIFSVLQQPKTAEPSQPPKPVVSSQDNRTKTLNQGRPTALPSGPSFPKPPMVVRPAISAIVPKKRLSIGSEHSQAESTTSDPDQPQLNPALLSTPSSRMSYAWSVASTRDEDSRPVSPTDLDRIALGLTSSLEEYANLLAELVVRECVLEASGTDLRSPRPPSNKQECSGIQCLCTCTLLPNNVLVICIKHSSVNLHTCCVFVAAYVTTEAAYSYDFVILAKLLPECYWDAGRCTLSFTFTRENNICPFQTPWTWFSVLFLI